MQMSIEFQPSPKSEFSLIAERMMLIGGVESDWRI